MTSSMLHPFLSHPLDAYSLLVDTLSTNQSKLENSCAPIPEPLFFTILCTLLNTFSLPTTITRTTTTIGKIYTNNHSIDILYKIW
jgi:hypothetical protein